MKTKKNSTLLRRALQILFIALVGYLGYQWYLSYSGYCFKERRYLTDEDLIQAAIRYNLYSINIDGSEESIRTFHAKHPGCCRVDRTSHMTSSFIENILGFYYVEVELNFELKPERIDRSKPKPMNFYTQYVPVNACGERGAMYGEHTETLKGN